MGSFVFMNQLTRVRLTTFLTLFLITGVVLMGKAQSYQVPVSEDFEFSDPADYGNYENDIVKCATFILSTSSVNSGDDWNKASSWLLKWVLISTV